MTEIVYKVLFLDERIRKATDSYIDDIIVNEDNASAEEAKPPENIDGGQILSLWVRKVISELCWKRDSVVLEISDKATKRDLFSWAGRMVRTLSDRRLA